MFSPFLPRILSLSQEGEHGQLVPSPVGPALWLATWQGNRGVPGEQGAQLGEPSEPCLEMLELKSAGTRASSAPHHEPGLGWSPVVPQGPALDLAVFRGDLCVPEPSSLSLL
ncbi:hypothetical protein H1C71_038611 [Ictidomys tridecemlineatus]|nr:hypothetical protein H1C71_038611 [Ictidomys tridecemlineatus]